MPELSHFDEHGSARMVDVGAKEITSRMARAESFVTMRPETLKLILDKQVGELLLRGVPAALPADHDAGAESDGIDFLTHSFFTAQTRRLGVIPIPRGCAKIVFSVPTPFLGRVAASA